LDIRYWNYKVGIGALLSCIHKLGRQHSGWFRHAVSRGGAVYRPTCGMPMQPSK